jgi:hypothetical protein
MVPVHTTAGRPIQRVNNVNACTQPRPSWAETSRSSEISKLLASQYNTGSDAAVTVAFVFVIVVAAHNVSCKSLPRCRRDGSSPRLGRLRDCDRAPDARGSHVVRVMGIGLNDILL